MILVCHTLHALIAYNECYIIQNRIILMICGWSVFIMIQRVQETEMQIKTVEVNQKKDTSLLNQIF